MHCKTSKSCDAEGLVKENAESFLFLFYGFVFWMVLGFSRVFWRFPIWRGPFPSPFPGASRGFAAESRICQLCPEHHGRGPRVGPQRGAIGETNEETSEPGWFGVRMSCDGLCCFLLGSSEQFRCLLAVPGKLTLCWLQRLLRQVGGAQKKDTMRD